MGIPFYFRKVVRHFPHVIHGTKPAKSARLFLDFNGIIHTCAALLKEESAAEGGGGGEGASARDFEPRLIARVCDYVGVVVATAQPSALLFISIDGMPSTAKVQQQRRRRYCSALEASVSASPVVWDTNAISPGTPFMGRLAIALAAMCAKESGWAAERVLSDSLAPGEGEHKIIEYIRTHPPPAGTTDLVYGLDADLIMLSVLESTPISLMRETQAFEQAPDKSAARRPFTFMDITQFRVVLRSHLASEYGISGDDAVHVYVFLCFFIGNDFLPALSFLKLQEEGLETIMSAYRQCEDSGSILIKTGSSYKINYHMLWRWMEVLQKTEDAAFMAVHNAYVRSHRAQLLRQSNRRIAYVDPSANMFARASAWRLDYYHYLLDPSADSPCVEHACRQYLEGLQWLVDLYFHQAIHAPGWYYSFNYSPTILDIYNYMTSQLSALPAAHAPATLKAAYARHEIPDTELLLLAILPPASLPVDLRPIATDPRYGAVHLFPRSFPLQMYLRRQAWECPPLLPQVDFQLLQRARQRLRKGAPAVM
jgi:5'-3' exonuclease